MFRLIKIFVVLLLTCGLFIILLPTLASTHWGRQQVVNWVNHTIPGKIELRNLDLHWGKGQLLEGFSLKDLEGNSILNVEKISTEATLWQLLRKSTRLGHTKIEDFNATITTNEKGWTNLQHSLGISLINHSVHHSTPSTIILSHVNADLYSFVDHHPLSASITGLTQQDNLKGSFEIHLSLNGLQASADWKDLQDDAQNYLSIDGSKEAKLHANISNFPVDLFDRLIAIKNPDLNGIFHSILGDRLNLIIDKESSQEGLAFNLTALAPLMQGNIKGKLVNDILTLQEPAIFHFNLSPEFINPLTHDQIELLDFSRLKVVFSTLTFPLNFLNSEISIDPCQLGFDAEITLPETDMNILTIGKLNISNFQAHLNSSLCNKKIQLKVEGIGKQSEESFNLDFDSTINKPKNLPHLLQQLRQGLQASLKITHLPLHLISSFREHPEWIEQIGPHADVEVVFTSKTNEDLMTAALSFQTSHLTLKNAEFFIGNEIILKSPAQLFWNGNINCLQTLLKGNEFILDEPCLAQFTLKEFQLPLGNPKFIKYRLESVIPHLKFSKLLSFGILDIQDLSLTIDGQNLNFFNSLLKARLRLLNAEGLDSPLVKTPLQLNQTSHWKVENDGNIEMLSGQFQLNNSISDIQAEGRLTANHQFELTQPLQIQYLLTPVALQTINQLSAKEWPNIQEETPIRFTIDPTSIDLNLLSLSTLKIQGILAIDQLALQGFSGAPPKLTSIEIPWIFDAPMSNFSASVTGFASKKNGKPNQISAQMRFWPQQGNFHSFPMMSEIHMNFESIPTSLLNIFLTTSELSPLIGPKIDLNVKALFNPIKEEEGYLDLALNSSQFHLNGRFKLNDTVTLLDPTKPPTINLTVTPESYQYLNKIFKLSDERKLAAPFTLSGTLSQFNLPLKDYLLNRGRVLFQLSTSDIQWQKASTPPIKLQGQIDSQNLLEHIKFSAQAFTVSSSISLQGTLSNIFDQKNKLRDWQEMGLMAEIESQKLTPPLLQEFLLLDQEQTQKLKAIFGDSLEFKASCKLLNLNGPIQISAIGAQGEIVLDGQLKQGVLMLNQPLKGSVKMTPLLSQTFLAKNVPILSTAIGAENPIIFTIDPSQFSCPLIPFQLEKVKIGKGILDLGKVNFRNEGELSSFLSLIRSISGPYLNIWFTPLHFQLDHGLLMLKRLDMLIAKTYTLASWGDINLMNHQADLVIGLTAQTLQYTFGIKGLEDQYILQVPLRSANGKVEIDKKKATARISSLVAQTQGGATGKLLGNLLDLALSKDGEASPSPTTQPFPWKEEFSSSPSSIKQSTTEETSPQIQEKREEKKKKKHKHQKKDSESNDTVSDLQKGAIQILDQLLSEK